MIFDPVAGGFQPSRVKINQNQGTTSIAGKIRAIANGVVSTDVYNDPLNYDFGKGDYYVNEGTFKGLFLVGYDYRNEKLRVFASKYGAAENTYQTTLDHLIQEDFKGHEVLGGVEDYITWVNSFVLTKNGDDVALHRFDFSQSSVNGYLPNKHIVVARKKMPEMMNQIGIRYRNGAGFWYFASGRKLYRFSNSGFDVQEVLTLPNDGTGDITAWNFDYSPAGQFKYIIVATYNPSSTKEFKGSVYTYAINGTTPLNVETEVTHKVVDLKAGYLPY